MNRLQQLLVTTALAGCAFCTAAQTMRPGLWEASTEMEGSGETGRAMAEAQKQLDNLPPEQRKMMAAMLAKQGFGLGQQAGAMSVKLCLTQEMVERNEVTSTQRDECTHTTAPRSGNTMKFSFVCKKPPSRGEGQVTFVSPEAYTMQMTINSSVNGKPETIKMKSSAKFLSVDCGSIKPIAVPKK